jgi:hypothetical protein
MFEKLKQEKGEYSYFPNSSFEIVLPYLVGLDEYIRLF